MRTVISTIILILLKIGCLADSWVAKDTCMILSGPNSSNAFSSGNKAYVLSRMSLMAFPYNTLFEYDPVLDAWTQKASYPDRSNGGTVAASVGTSIFIGLGVDSFGLSYNFYEYNTILNTWSQKSNFPGVGANFPFITSTQNEIIAGCGIDSNGVFSNEVWQYSPLSDSWNQLTDFPFMGYFNSAETYNNEVYVTHADTLTATTQLWKYDFNSNVWIQLSSCPVYMESTKSFIINANIFIGLGNKLTPFVYNTDFWKYDITTDLWQQVASYPGLANQIPVSFSVNNNGYVAFGEQFGVPCAEVWQYIPDSLTSLIEVEKGAGLFIYPSVSRDFITVHTKLKNFKIVDACGRKMKLDFNEMIEPDGYVMNISSYKAGLYFIINNETSIRFVKI
jgi:hypothetical protein